MQQYNNFINPYQQLKEEYSSRREKNDSFIKPYENETFDYNTVDQYTQEKKDGFIERLNRNKDREQERGKSKDVSQDSYNNNTNNEGIGSNTNKFTRADIKNKINSYYMKKMQILNNTTNANNNTQNINLGSSPKRNTINNIQNSIGGDNRNKDTYGYKKKR